MAIIAHTVGPGTQVIARRIWNKVAHHNINLIATDGNFAYNEILPKEKHIINKSETCLVESFNARLRHYIPCLARRTMCYAKSRKTLDSAVDIFLNKEKIFDYI